MMPRQAFNFRPRKAVDKYGRVYVNFSPAASPAVLKGTRQEIRGWHLQLKNDKSLMELSRMLNSILRGWWQYYGRFYRSKLASIGEHLDRHLVRWLMCKFKYFAGHKTRAWRYLATLKQRHLYAFVHWSEQAKGRMARECHVRLCEGLVVRLYRSTHPYLPMARGFVYLAALVDWYSRRVLSWKVSPTMDVHFCLEVVEETMERR